jgi:hypothetical protein
MNNGVFKTSGRMFSFVTDTCNPLGGECKNDCSYCWAKMLIKRYKIKKYYGEHRIFEAQLDKISKFSKDKCVFICDMLDLFEDSVPKEMIQRILDNIVFSDANFLLLTKFPKRYLEFDIPVNCICGATVETDKGEPGLRLDFMKKLNHPRKMICVEPIMKFSPNFPYKIIEVKPEIVAVGYDNYYNHLPEPSLLYTQFLIRVLRSHKFNVVEKTLREPLF